MHWLAESPKTDGDSEKVVAIGRAVLDAASSEILRTRTLRGLTVLDMAKDGALANLATDHGLRKTPWIAFWAPQEL